MELNTKWAIVLLLVGVAVCIGLAYSNGLSLDASHERRDQLNVQTKNEILERIAHIERVVTSRPACVPAGVPATP